MADARRPWGAVLIGLWVTGCTGTEAPAPEPITPERASEQVTFGTLQDIGAFTFEYSTRDTRTAAGTSTVRDAAGSLKWKDRDNWEYSTVLDGVAATRWLVTGGRAFQALSGGPLLPKGDPEPLRAQLALGWDPWDDLVAITGGRITYGPGVAEVIDGRDAMRHTLSLTPVPPPKRVSARLGAALAPVRLSGQVWIDAATSVRLLADLEVEATNVPPTPAPDPADPAGATPAEPLVAADDPRIRTRTFAIKLAVTGLGQDPGVSAPPEAPVSPVPGKAE